MIKVDEKTYDQYVTNHEKSLKALEEEREILKAHLADLSLLIRQTRFMIKKAKSKLERE